jgi:type II secretion system protein H
LFELIAVMVIAGALLAMIAPSLHGFQSRRSVMDQAAALVAVMDWARQKAIADGMPYRLNIDITEREYWLTQQPESDFIAVSHDMGRRFQWDTTVQLRVIEPSDAIVTFVPDGTASDATLKLTGRDGTTLTIARDVVTGRYEVRP